MDLEARVDGRRKDIKSDRLSMSIGELAGLYSRGELDIHPKFQRVLRWDDQQKTSLIESILLRIPIPPIFVAQDASGKWDVVDGVQRLGSIFQFLGILLGPDGKKWEPLILSKTHLIPELDGLLFKSEIHPQKSFPSPLQLDFQRSRLDLQILLKESDPSAKYELFERLNTGGSCASDQEVRNCVLVWINEPLFDWMRNKLNIDQNFLGCVPLTDHAEEQQYRMELVLRFLAFFEIDESELKKITDIGEFLNLKNRELALTKSLDRKRIDQRFTETFRLLYEALGEDSFRKYDSKNKSHRGGFLISSFEAIAFGLAHNLDLWKGVKSPKAIIQKRVSMLWSKPEFLEHIGIGVPARDRIKWSVPVGREIMKP